jgi:hypothetical protein
MKKVLLLLFVFVMGASAAYAQISGGLRVGANVSGYQTENGDGSVKFGPSIGAFAQIKVWKISIQPEINYSQQGVYGNLEKDDFINEKNFGPHLETFQALTKDMALFAEGKEAMDKLHYIQIPVMVKIFPIGGLNIQVGPQFSYLASSSRQFTDEFMHDINQLNEVYKGATGDPNNMIDAVKEGELQNFKSADISLNVGLGFDIWKLDIAARANIGLNDLREATTQEELAQAVKDPLFAVTEKTKNINFQFSVGYKIF